MQTVQTYMLIWATQDYDAFNVTVTIFDLSAQWQHVPQQVQLCSYAPAIRDPGYEKWLFVGQSGQCGNLSCNNMLLINGSHQASTSASIHDTRSTSSSSFPSSAQSFPTHAPPVSPPQLSSSPRESWWIICITWGSMLSGFLPMA